MELWFEFASIVTVAFRPRAGLPGSLSCGLASEDSTRLLADRLYGKKNAIYLLVWVCYSEAKHFSYVVSSYFTRVLWGWLSYPTWEYMNK